MLHSLVRKFPSNLERKAIGIPKLLYIRLLTAGAGDSTEIIKNEKIKAENIRLVSKDSEGKSSWQIITKVEALKIAKSKELDLILVSMKTDPPVCRLEKYKDVLMARRQKDKEMKKSQKARSLKEMYIGVNIDPHDLGIKLDKIKEFIANGHQVKVSLISKKADLQKNPLALDQLTLRTLDLVEPFVGAIQEPENKSSIYRKEFTLNPK
jgi:translation initiation factor IF-3